MFCCTTKFLHLLIDGTTIKKQGTTGSQVFENCHHMGTHLANTVINLQRKSSLHNRFTN
jgi:hypothetical protein